MNNIAKVLRGVGVVGAVAVTAYVVTKKSEPKQEATDSDISVGAAGKEKNIIERIKTFVLKKVIKILGWVVLHQQKIEAVGTILGIVGAVLSVVNAVRDYRNGLNLQKQLDYISDHVKEEEAVWNKYVVWHEDRHNEVMNKLNDIHIDMSCTPVIKKKKSA